MTEILTSLVTVLINYSLRILEWWNESDIDNDYDFLGHSRGKFPGAREYVKK